jgi:predicted dehydrogenase
VAQVAHVEACRKAENAELYALCERADAHFYRRQLEGFASTIRDGAPQQGTGIEEGIDGVRAMIATTRSVASGDWVELDGVEGTL